MRKQIALIAFVIGFIIFFYFYYENNATTQSTLRKHFSLKPSIYTEDNKTLAYSIPLYKVMIHRNCANRNECNLLHILQPLLRFDMKKAQYMAKKYTYFPLSYEVNETLAKDLQWLAQKLQPLYDKRTQKYYKPLLVQLSGEKRIYPCNDTLTPVLGYTRKTEQGTFTIRQGVTGLEAIKSNGSLLTTINFAMQKKLEQSIDNQKNYQEIIAAIFDLNTNEIKALASTLRYDPNHIKKEDIGKLATHCNQYLFSSPTLLKPLVMAIQAQEKNITSKNLLEFINRLQLNKQSSELPHERQMDIAKYVRQGGNISNIKLNFLQTLKLYATFYRKGKLAQPKIIKDTQTINIQIIPSALAYEAAKEIDTNQSVLLEFPDCNKTANLQINKKKNLLTIMLLIKSDK